MSRFAANDDLARDIDVRNWTAEIEDDIASHEAWCDWQISLRRGSSVSLAMASFAIQQAGRIVEDPSVSGDGYEDPKPYSETTPDGTCRRCAGTGQFITYVENGVPKGPGGICFRCGGKGIQTEADQRRNWGYDNFAPIYDR